MGWHMTGSGMGDKVFTEQKLGAGEAERHVIGRTLLRNNYEIPPTALKLGRTGVHG